MQLPPDSHIAPAKITDYLLVWQSKGDKSRFLGRAGYDASLADQLLHDIRTQVLPCDAVPCEMTEYGQYYEISCPLTGPNGHTLAVRTIWMTERLSGITKFITLIPANKLPNET